MFARVCVNVERFLVIGVAEHDGACYGAFCCVGRLLTFGCPLKGLFAACEGCERRQKMAASRYHVSVIGDCSDERTELSEIGWRGQLENCVYFLFPWS